MSKQSVHTPCGKKNHWKKRRKKTPGDPSILSLSLDPRHLGEQAVIAEKQREREWGNHTHLRENLRKGASVVARGRLAQLQLRAHLPVYLPTARATKEKEAETCEDTAQTLQRGGCYLEC